MIRKRVWLSVFTLAGALLTAALMAALPSPAQKKETAEAGQNPRERAAQFTVVGKAPANKSAADFDVKIDNFSFGPQAITVPVGATIAWTNRDDIPHTVVSEGLFKSKVLDTDEKFSYRFDKAGTYSYFCSLHPKMTGKVVVE
jgi:plastocyanin